MSRVTPQSTDQETPLAAQSTETLLAALRLQQEWGAEALIEDQPWAVISAKAPPVQSLHAARTPASVSTPAPVSPQPSQEISAAKDLEEAGEADVLGAGSFEELAARSGQVAGLSLARTAMHHLHPVQVPQAPFMLIGEVPNADEDRSGQLFAGEAGILLRQVLASIGLSAGQLSMAPAIPWRPPGGRPLSAGERQAALPILQRSIALCRPAFLVTMGATAAAMLLGTEKRLAQLRGQWVEVTVPGLDTPLPLLPTLHPLQLAGGPAPRRALWKDMLALRRKLAGG
ncbi:uracil-DNA glycosylase [Oecophyllibacter saccharovorans]|uniref:uracil-DNA glycosylase n=1 Tax=Oecophyllibacter saccharovorans TaxID=2558360 RepID=UPI0011432C80|nr:uracil-DNA glycosylase [Oecophyllibacter saccharovorans]QDH14839.1 uracil-DNA glycosylase [Oecophyllibacter saccharovorans]